MAPANARCGGPPPPDGGIETAGRPPKVTIALYRPSLRLLPLQPGVARPGVGDSLGALIGAAG